MLGREIALALALLAACTHAEPPAIRGAARPAFDAARLRTGRFRYHTALHGDDAGTSTISVVRVDARSYRFSNEVTGAFRQTWEAVSSAALEPIQATLGLGADDSKARTMRLLYRGRSVTGTATRTSPGEGTHTDEIAAELPPTIVDQRIDWAALMSAPLSPGAALDFTVYDPWTGISPVTARVGAPEEIDVPAGRFRVVRVAYQIAKHGRGVETYEIWVAERPPRMLVREDFPSGATTQLVQILE